MGNGNTVREYCFLTRGTLNDKNKTQIGDDNWFMGYVHIGHDCVVGNGAAIANCVQFAGHVKIAHRAIIGGGTLLAPFRRVGEGAMIGGGEKLRMDLPPYAWYSEGVMTVNAKGMKRGGFNETEIGRMKEAFRFLYGRNLPIKDAKDAILSLTNAENGRIKVALTTLMDF